MKDTEKLLSRINNLISDDSAILKEFASKIDKASSDKKKVEEEKKKFEGNIKDIQTDIDDITKVSELNERFTNLDVFMSGLEKLGDSCNYIKKLTDELGRIPEKIEELEHKISDLNEKTTSAEEKIKEDEDELSKLDVDLSDAKRYQTNLVELIDLAKTGDINKTREEVVETLVHVGFNDADSINAAKVILFPEDDLIPYFNKENKTKKETVEETQIEEEVEEPKEIETESNTEIDLEENIKNEKELSVDSEKQDDNYLNNENEMINPFEDNTIETINENVDLKELLNNNGLDIDEFNVEDLDGLKNSSESLITKNIDFLLNNNIKKDAIYGYPSLLVDTELSDKYDFIINELGKSAEDIKLTPVILISYSLDDFKKLVEVANKTGIDAKHIPLMVYVKGLQGFLQNYVLLNNNDINLDDNELSKFASILAINPIDFKMSLQTILNYKLSLKKNNGKYEIMCLAKSSKELMKEMDLIIEAGEEDILKFYPEVLSADVESLVNRLLFIKKAGIPYKASSHGETVYQSYVLSQEKLEKIVEKKLDLHELADNDESNKIIKNNINDPELMDALDDISMDDMLESYNLDNYKDIIKKYKHIDESDNTYIINNVIFSKNKVNANINYLINNYEEANKDIILLTSLFHDAHKSETDLNKVIETLNIKIG